MNQYEKKYIFGWSAIAHMLISPRCNSWHIQRKFLPELLLPVIRTVLARWTSDLSQNIFILLLYLCPSSNKLRVMYLATPSLLTLPTIL